MNSPFFNLLEKELALSDTNKRLEWVNYIISNNIPIKDLSSLLFKEKKVAIRFSWLLSELGTIAPNILLLELPSLLVLSKDVNQFNFTESFANYWNIVGVPIINEAEALEMLFTWLKSTSINVTIKSRCVLVLYNLTKKYPDLKNEFKLCLEDQIDKYSKDFEKRSLKILSKLL